MPELEEGDVISTDEGVYEVKRVDTVASGDRITQYRFRTIVGPHARAKPNPDDSLTFIYYVNKTDEDYEIKESGLTCCFCGEGDDAFDDIEWFRVDKTFAHGRCLR